MDELKVFVLGHTDEMLAAVPRAPYLVPTDLRSLNLPEQYNTNLLAECRFLLSDEATDLSATFIGLGSANWSMRFPGQLGLDELSELTPLLKENRVFAPRLSHRWQESEEEWHPGMTRVVDEIAAHFGFRTQGTAPYSNSFICHRGNFADLLVFWREAWEFAYSRYGFDIPFTYRCPECGTESHDGIGRFRSSRHAGFLGENLTMLYFANRRDLSFYGTNPRLARPAIARALRGPYWSLRGR